MPCITKPPDYSLVITMLPSFILPLFRFNPIEGTFVKRFGWREGAVLWVDGDKVCCEACSYAELLSWSGLWCVDSMSLIGIAAPTSIGLAVSPWDDILVFTAVFLSQNTSYTRVLRWVERLYPAIVEGSYHMLIGIADTIGSYQVRRLLEAINSYLDIRLNSYHNIWLLRSKLLSIKYVGVKVAHAHILFTTYTGVIFPVDRHLRRYLGIASHLPDKSVCMRYACPQCPFRRSCPVANLAERYSVKAGLFQTMVWIYSQDLNNLIKLLDLVSTQHQLRTLHDIIVREARWIVSKIA